MNADQRRSTRIDDDGQVELLHSDITERIIGAFYSVYNQLGCGFLERVYENALAVELSEMGLRVVCQMPLTVWFKGHIVGEYVADIVVENAVLVELKACEALTVEHEAQLVNYLKATSFEVGLLLNFGRKPEVRRRVYSNRRKGTQSWLSAGQ